MPIDLSHLESRFASFRSDELFFIRLASPYIATIFRTVFGRSNKERLKYIRGILMTDKFEKGDGLYLRQALAPQFYMANSPRPIDATNGPFRRLISAIETPDVITHFEDTLKLQFGIYERFRCPTGIRSTLMSFEEAIICLINRRNFLEHYAKMDKKGRYKDRENYNQKRQEGEAGYSDDALMSALGLFLLPDIFHLFVGRIASYEAKLGIKSDNAERLRHQIKAITKTRRERTKQRISNELTRAKITDKALRKKLLLGRDKWRDAYVWLQDDATDYRENEFKLRYHFIGAQNIDLIVRFLHANGAPQKLHFKSQIEAFYILSVNINLIIHRFLQNAPRDEKDHPVFPDAELTKSISAIRNTIAHNGLFWNVHRGDEIMTVDQVLGALFEAAKTGLVAKSHPDANVLNDLYSSLERLLKEQNYSTAYFGPPVAEQPTLKFIRRWKKEARQKFGQDRSEAIRLDKRKAIRKICGLWYHHLNAAKVAICAKIE
jgi:hypothetical protein